MEIAADTAQIIKNGRKNATLADIFPWDRAAISGKIAPDGSYLAQHIVIKPPPVKKHVTRKMKKSIRTPVKKKLMPITKKK